MDVRLNRERGLDYVDWLFLLMEADRSAPDGAVEALQGKTAFYGPLRPEDDPGPYRADFILWGPRERELGREDLEEALAPRLFIEAGDYRIYRISEGAGHQPHATE